MKKLKEIIDGKRRKGLNQPKYGLRKLSVGIVSCMVGCVLFLSPVTAQAMEVEPIKQDMEQTKIDIQATEHPKIDIKATEYPKIDIQGNYFENKADNDNTLTGRKQKEQVEKTLWVDGVEIEDKDFENIKDEKNKLDYFAAEHGKGSGYYDVNKKFDERDGLLCSGAVASNMLHWWIEQNKDNIEKFKQQAPGTNGVIHFWDKSKKTVDELKEFYKEDGDTYSDQSRFFDLIKTSFTNKALVPEQLLNLYLNGWGYHTTQSEIKQRNEELTNPSSINLFNKVLGGKVLTNIQSFNGIDDFSKKVTEAISSHKALGLSYKVLSANTGYGHIVTVWGADVDKDGKVKAIYITDSDDRKDKIDGSNKRIGMRRYLVNEDTNGKIRLTGYKKDNEDTGTLNLHLYTLDRGDKEWAAYFKNHPEKIQEDKKDESNAQEKPIISKETEKPVEPKVEDTENHKDLPKPIEPKQTDDITKDLEKPLKHKKDDKDISNKLEVPKNDDEKKNNGIKKDSDKSIMPKKEEVIPNNQNLPRDNQKQEQDKKQKKDNDKVIGKVDIDKNDENRKFDKSVNDLRKVDGTVKSLKKEELPKTGDLTNTGIYMGAAAIAGIGIVAAGLKKKKNNKE